LILAYFIVAQGTHVLSLRPYNPGWATMRYDDPWYGKRHLTEP
jgi:hypothetical protein